MLGLMQDWPLLCHKILDHAAKQHGAREVVSRKLDAFAKAGWVATDRGEVQLRDLPALRRTAGR